MTRKIFKQKIKVSNDMQIFKNKTNLYDSHGIFKITKINTSGRK